MKEFTFKVSIDFVSTVKADSKEEAEKLLDVEIFCVDGPGEPFGNEVKSEQVGSSFEEYK